MKNFISRALSLALAGVCLASFFVTAFAKENSDAPPKAISESYCVMSVETGQVLIQKNMDKKEYPASITKIMTIALALENAELDDRVVITKEAIAGLTREDASIGLREGEEASLRDLIYATHLMSANDSANAIAIHIAGSIKDFAKMMNDKARELGCTGTSFVNPNGLPNESHLTTAYDMALITRYALGVPGFERVFNETKYVMKKTNKTDEDRPFSTFHNMLVNTPYAYDEAKGGKLGWTKPSGHTIVTTASKSGMDLICVCMKSSQRGDKYKDTIALFDYCFDNFHKEILRGETLKANPIPVLKGEKVIFELEPIFKDKYELFLHNYHSLADLVVSSNLKESYSIGESINPRLLFTVKSCGEEMEDSFSIPLEYKGGKTAGTSITTAFDHLVDGFVDVILSGLVLLIKVIAIGVGIMLIIRFYHKGMFSRKHASSNNKSKKKL